MPENSAQLRHARRCSKQRANRKLFKGEKPKIPIRSSFPTVEELMVWITPKPGELANKIQALHR